MKRLIAVFTAVSMAVSLIACTGPGTKQTKAPGTEEALASGKESGAAPDSAGAQEEKAEPGSTPCTIRFSWWGGDTRHEATKAAVDAFMAKYPNIKVECEYGTWDGWTEKVATQLSAGTAPDLLQGNWNWLYQYSGDGSKFVDLKQYAHILSLDNYPQEILDDCVVGGKLQGLPLGTNTKCFYWNKTTFEKAGIPIPGTWDELYAAGDVFQTKLGGDYYPMAMFQYERMLLMLYYIQEKYQKPWAENNVVAYTPEEVLDGLEFINSLEKKHVMPSVKTLQGDGATTIERNQNWMSGKYAGIYEWDAAQAKFDDSLDEGQEFVLGPHITGEGMKDAGFTKITQTFSIPETSEHPAEAALLLEFITSVAEGVKLMSTERGMLLNQHANEVLENEGILKGLSFEGNQQAMKVARFAVDPNFENSALKDDTGIYYEVFENLSAGGDPAELAQYLIDSCNEVYAANPY
ncbi:ABC transporter substrate-binding protein [Lacrimispora sp.]|jgi:oligogalacturonide transport system substrate-binding protein|uniref:ABC transporter substrate-binding protein n=1 Tax=Lacrimispora sp. TaxID=2719234 RepID=UPI0028A28706|nr:ABC transporter substrate-binding protein [Lacrimispora sp.]